MLYNSKGHKSFEGELGTFDEGIYQCQGGLKAILINVRVWECFLEEKTLSKSRSIGKNWQNGERWQEMKKIPGKNVRRQDQKEQKQNRRQRPMAWNLRTAGNVSSLGANINPAM